jgi:hypothetical protein
MSASPVVAGFLQVCYFLKETLQLYLESLLWLGWVLVHILPVRSALKLGSVAVIFWVIFCMTFSSIFRTVCDLPLIGLLRSCPHSQTTRADFLGEVCQLPLMALLPPCKASPPSQPQTDRVQQLLDVQSSFEDILEGTTEAMPMQMHLKLSEMGILRATLRIRYSQLPLKHDLESAHAKFARDIPEAAAALQNFILQTNYLFDSISGSLRYTVQQIEKLHVDSANRSFAARLFYKKSDQSSLINSYLDHIGHLSTDVASLIDLAQTSDQKLVGLHKAWNKIDTQKHRSLNMIREERDIKAKFGRRLGWFWDDVTKMDRQREFLLELQEMHQPALIFVERARFGLEKVQMQLQQIKQSFAIEGLRYDGMALAVHLEMLVNSLKHINSRKDHVNKVRDGMEEQVQKQIRGGLLHLDILS